MARRSTAILAVAAVYIGVAVLLLVGVLALTRGGEGAGVFGPRVAVLELEGIIVDADQLVRDLRAHRDNAMVRAVVVRINSPGGVVAPTQELHAAIQQLREAGKPVVASLGAVAASGGYYVAVAADRIYANPGTLTGSIGVMMQLANLEALLKKVGVDYVVVKAGEYKDLGNISRAMSPRERRVIQALLDDVHGQFVQAVADGRKLEAAEVRRVADGRVFSGAQALQLQMVDALGGLEDAINGAAELAGLPVPPRVVFPRRRLSIFDLVRNSFGGGATALLGPALPGFNAPLYLMD